MLIRQICSLDRNNLYFKSKTTPVQKDTQNNKNPILATSTTLTFTGVATFNILKCKHKPNQFKNRNQLCNFEELKKRLSEDKYSCIEILGKDFHSITDKDIYNLLKVKQDEISRQKDYWEKISGRKLDFESPIKYNNLFSHEENLQNKILNSDSIGADSIQYRGEVDNGSKEFTHRFNTLKNMPLNSIYTNDKSLWTTESLRYATDYLENGLFIQGKCKRNDTINPRTPKILFEFLIPASTKIRMSEIERTDDTLYKNKLAIAESIVGQQFIIKDRIFDENKNLLKIFGEYVS